MPISVQWQWRANISHIKKAFIVTIHFYLPPLHGHNTGHPALASSPWLRSGQFCWSAVTKSAQSWLCSCDFKLSVHRNFKPGLTVTVIRFQALFSLIFYYRTGRLANYHTILMYNMHSIQLQYCKKCNNRISKEMTATWHTITCLLTSCTSRNSQSTSFDSFRPNILTPRLMNWNSRQYRAYNSYVLVINSDNWCVADNCLTFNRVTHGHSHSLTRLSC